MAERVSILEKASRKQKSTRMSALFLSCDCGPLRRRLLFRRLPTARAQRLKLLIQDLPLFPRKGVPAQQRQELRRQGRSSKLRGHVDQTVLLLAHISALETAAHQPFIPRQLFQELREKVVHPVDSICAAAIASRGDRRRCGTLTGQMKRKDRSLSAAVLWQRVKDSNPHKRSQSPVCYHYTNPLCSFDEHL